MGGQFVAFGEGRVKCAEWGGTTVVSRLLRARVLVSTRSVREIQQREERATDLKRSSTKLVTPEKLI